MYSLMHLRCLVFKFHKIIGQRWLSDYYFFSVIMILSTYSKAYYLLGRSQNFKNLNFFAVFVTLL